VRRRLPRECRGAGCAPRSVVLACRAPEPTFLPQPGRRYCGNAPRPWFLSVAGTVEHYAVTPALPRRAPMPRAAHAGTPSAATTLAPYTITASSSGPVIPFHLTADRGHPSSRSGHCWRGAVDSGQVSPPWDCAGGHLPESSPFFTRIHARHVHWATNDPDRNHCKGPSCYVKGNTFCLSHSNLQTQGERHEDQT